MRFVSALPCALALALSAGTASSKDARCELTVDGTTYISGMCDFAFIGSFKGDGSFMITGRNGYFAYVLQDDATMTGYWNGVTKGTHAHDELGTLQRDQRDRACWFNDYARVCAW